MSERDQWTLASNLLEMWGHAISDYLGSQMAASLDDGDEHSYLEWAAICEKVARMLPPNPATSIH
jgi:hypothetical protein